MAAVARKPVASKKRKVLDDLQHHQPDVAKKKSPLFNHPQNHYAPQSISSMSKDELSVWRKEQRRKRNRESAAASRNKTRSRIDELEGEVDKWKLMYHDMSMKMRCMEQHIQFLTKMNIPQQQGLRPGFVALPLASSPAPVVSHPNSPPLSPQPSGPPPSAVPNAVTSFMPPPPAYSSITNAHLFPPLLSEPKAYALVEKQEAAVVTSEDSKKHIKPISRQA